jgi:peptidoglycan-associated lipoprotein
MKKIYSALAIAAAMSLMAGCSSKSKKDAAPSDVVENTGAAVESAPAVVIDTTFYFEFDSAELTEAAKSALMLHAEQLAATPRAVRLEGHADERGSREYNMALGERRANAVRDFLVLQGVSATSLETVSYGEEQAAEQGTGEAVWSKNRRVELK